MREKWIHMATTKTEAGCFCQQAGASGKFLLLFLIIRLINVFMEKRETCRSGFDCRDVSRSTEMLLGSSWITLVLWDIYGTNTFYTSLGSFTGCYKVFFNQNIHINLWLCTSSADFEFISFIYLELLLLPLLHSPKEPITAAVHLMLPSPKFCETFVLNVLNNFSSGLVTIRSASLWAHGFAAFSGSVDRSLCKMAWDPLLPTEILFSCNILQQVEKYIYNNFQVKYEAMKRLTRDFVSFIFNFSCELWMVFPCRWIKWSLRDMLVIKQ